MFFPAQCSALPEPNVGGLGCELQRTLLIGPIMLKKAKCLLLVALSQGSKLHRAVCSQSVRKGCFSVGLVWGATWVLVSQQLRHIFSQ